MGKTLSLRIFRVVIVIAAIEEKKRSYRNKTWERERGRDSDRKPERNAGY